MSVRFVLAPQAALDLVEIWRYIKEQTSLTIADRVESAIRGKIEFLAGTSGAGHSRKDLTDEDVKFFPVYSYLIVYRPQTTPLQVAAILHGRRDVERSSKAAYERQRERSMAGQYIDRDKLRTAVRKMGTEYVFLMLDDAITLLPETKLRKLIAQYLNPHEFRPDSAKKVDLLADVKAFQKASLAGEYHQAFAVNSKNYTEKSSGTLAWIADCFRLLERCLAQSKKEDPKTVCQAFEIIFSLLSKIDEGNDDILFFADEGGSWQVGVDWEKVLPAWFRVLSATAGPSEYAQRTTTLLKRHHQYGRIKMLAAARKVATPAQRQALRERESEGAIRGRS